MLNIRSAHVDLFRSEYFGYYSCIAINANTYNIEFCGRHIYNVNHSLLIKKKKNMKHTDSVGLETMLKECGERPVKLLSQLKGIYKTDLVAYVHTLTVDMTKTKIRHLTKADLCNKLTAYAEEQYVRQSDKLTDQKRNDAFITRQKCQAVYDGIVSYEKGCLTKKCESHAVTNKKLAQREIAMLTDLETCKTKCPTESKATEDVNFSNTACNSIKQYMDVRKEKRKSENKVLQMLRRSHTQKKRSFN